MDVEDLRVVVFSDDPALIAEFTKAAGQIANLSFVRGSGHEVSSKERLDSLLMTVLQAAEYGAPYPYPIGKGFICPMPDEQIAAGLPRLIVASVALKKVPWIRNWRKELRLFLRAGIQAVRDHNDSVATDQRICRLGVPANGLVRHEVSVRTAINELRDALEASDVAVSGTDRSGDR